MRQLQKLTKRTFLSDGVSVPDEFRPVYDRLLAEVAESSQIHTEFERVGRRRSEQCPVGQAGFEFAPILRQIARPIGRDAGDEVGIDFGEQPLGSERGEFRAAA